MQFEWRERSQRFMDDQRRPGVGARKVFICLLLATAWLAHAAPAASEDRYIATRDAAIAKISELYDAGKGDEATKAEEAATANLLAQMTAIVHEPARTDCGPAKLNLGSFYKGDEDFGTLAYGSLDD